LGTGLREPVSLQQDGSLVRFLRLQNAPAKVYFEDPQSWVNGIPDLERSLLVALNAQVLIPITVESGLAGILSLGPKRSDTRYTRGDLQLLSAVASQTGLALENIRLTENIRDEIARRERLNRELEIAREVQQRLFPQKLPYVQGLDFAGYCRPALGVGGDYYDFIRLDNGCLGIAIGDVSGKGIAAALTMASLQASLRAQLIRPCENLAQMIEIVSRLVYEASSENRYATFFYAQYDPESRTVEYVNAGHNPPILYRQSEGRVKRLENGGTVLGLFERTSYVQDRLQLDSGDILVGFTDGVSEALNAADEEFGEERLIAAIANANSRSAADLITAILADADAFTRGAPQHDDMTLLVVRSR
jgi:sigma-B regulation protein RsbU (phosphoserine phosphatase)